MADILIYNPGREPGLSRGRNKYRIYHVIKRAFDLSVVLMVAPAALLAIAIMALLVRLDGSSAFYRQPRIGLGGRTFMLWKLRTMVPQAESKLETYLAAHPQARLAWNQSQKLRDDPRVTAIGRYLRKYSLDELPQLLNVLLGDMSLVGPRPILPEQRQLYDGTTYYQLRPGLTGLWQIGKRNEATFAERAVIDTEYFHRMSLFTDIWILSKTPIVVMRGTGV
ncbi:sugar transferase [Shinella sp. CPCC 101442]|uniref:sugar transferase n=1 Tax=Shinella sp. CPCC 101442 TaxID=2932265 RepID=UPI0021539F92|nr:sugar transferase [Shinella sp. CPCC 101442]MCR6502404.1 sugar transferase [Shinella sp. CPCC 101442]